MAQNVVCLRGTLSATGAGYTDFTSSGFGTPTAAIVIVGTANSSNNPEVDAICSYGFWDGTNSYCTSYFSDDGVATSDERRIQSTSYVAVVFDNISTLTYYTIAATTDGVRITNSVDSTALERYATVMLFTGISAAVGTVAPTVTVSGLSFAPELVLFAGDGAPNAANLSNSLFAYGVAEIGGGERGIAGYKSTGASTAVGQSLYINDDIPGQSYTSTWTCGVSAWNSDGFTVTVTSGSTGGDLLGYLALGGADFGYQMGEISTRTSAGDTAVSTPWKPQALLVMASSVATEGTAVTNSETNCLALGMSSGSDEFSVTNVYEDGSSGVNAESVASTGAVIDIDSIASGTRSDMVTATVAFNSSDFTLSYSLTDATARLGWYVAFGPDPSAVAASLPPLLARQKQRQQHLLIR